MVNHRTAALSSLPFASLPSSFIHLRTAAPEHFNACQQYVQQTCCACKQTHTHLHKITHSYTLHTHTHTHTQCHHQAGIMDKWFPISLSEQNNECGTHGANFPGLTEFNWQTVQHFSEQTLSGLEFDWWHKCVDQHVTTPKLHSEMSGDDVREKLSLYKCKCWWGGERRPRCNKSCETYRYRKHELKQPTLKCHISVHDCH